MKEGMVLGVSTCNDEEFKQYRVLWTKRLQEIKLPQDVSSGMGQTILSQLDEAYAYIRVDLGELEGAKDKTESIIRQNERSKAEGRNEDDRKKNATDYLENYPIGEGDEQESINMYEWTRLLNQRYTVVKSFVDIINNKQQRLITMSGFMKIDSNLGNNTH